MANERNIEVYKRFAKTIEELCEHMPADAGAVIVGKIALELGRQGPTGEQGLGTLLQLMWMQIAAEVTKHIKDTPQACDVAGMFLERYFFFLGDFPKMVADFEKTFAERYPDRVQWLAEQFEKVTKVAHEGVARAAATLN